jgi:hypothetical protein
LQDQCEKMGGKGGVIVQRNQGIKQQARWRIKMKEWSGATRAKNVLQGEVTMCDSKATQ